MGTGGTLAGVAMALKSFRSSVRIALADPMGAALYSYYTTGTLKSEGSSITEGIGQGRITKISRRADRYRLPNSGRRSGADHLRPFGARRALPRQLLRHQHRRRRSPAKELGPGYTIVTLAHYGTRYQSKLFNPQFLRDKKLPVPAWLERRSQIKVPYA